MLERGDQVPADLAQIYYHQYSPKLFESYQVVPVFKDMPLARVPNKPFLFAIKYNCMPLLKYFVEERKFDPFESDGFALWVLYFLHTHLRDDSSAYLADEFGDSIFVRHGFDHLPWLAFNSLHECVYNFTQYTLNAMATHSHLVRAQQHSLNDALLGVLRAMYELEKLERDSYKPPHWNRRDDNACIQVFDVMEMVIDGLLAHNANPFAESENYPSFLYYKRFENMPTTYSVAMRKMVDYLNDHHLTDRYYKERYSLVRQPDEVSAMFLFENTYFSYPKASDAFKQFFESKAQDYFDRSGSPIESDEPLQPRSSTLVFYDAFKLLEYYSPPRRKEEACFNLVAEKASKPAVMYRDDLVVQLEALAKQFPNFEQVVEHIVVDLGLIVDADFPLKIEPLLLVGEAGIGKTEIITQLSKVLGLEKVFFNMASSSANFTLSGIDNSWSGSQPGMVARTLVSNEYINFMLYLDEIDKVKPGATGGSPLAALFDLLEPNVAKTFQDQYYRDSVQFDASHISVVASGNSLENIDAPIQSRFLLFDIEPPSAQQKRGIVQSIYQHTRQHYKLTQRLAEQVPDAVVDYLVAYDPRQIRQALRSGLSQAVRKHHKELAIEHFSSHLNRQFNKHKSNPIGFVSGVLG